MNSLERIIYVDNEEDLREIVVIALEDVGGMTVDAFSSGAALLAALPAPPDLVLLDVMMPDMDGPTLMRELRGREGFDAVPFVFITAKVQPAEIDALLAEGAAGVAPHKATRDSSIILELARESISELSDFLGDR